MKKLQKSVKLGLLGLALTTMMIGCSSRLHTAVMNGPPVIHPSEKKQVNKLPEEVPLDKPIEVAQETIPSPGPQVQAVESESPGPPSEPRVPKTPLPIVKEESSPVLTPAPVVPPPETVSPLPTRLVDVFFDYNQYRVRKDGLSNLEADARLLAAKYSNQNVVIEGHSDERGTEDYNLVLGERRAQIVKDYLVDLGVPSDKLQVISYGKTRPFCTEHSLKCWQENRRGHLVVKEGAMDGQ